MGGEVVQDDVNRGAVGTGGTERWTLLIIRELLWGQDRFNAIARAVPRMSPTLLATRLRQLQRAGLVQRHLLGGEARYQLTAAGEELRPILELMGAWGVRWMQEVRPEEYDPALLMLDIGRESDSERMPERPATIQLHFADASAGQEHWWLVLSRSEGADVCDTDPGRPVTIWLDTDVSTLTRIWMGDLTWSAALQTESLRLTGDRPSCRALPTWLHVSRFAAVPRASSPLPR
ncbi:winged helix-turn-helix transcriptional regulator [Streptomyces brasiliensis]|uniref:HxlR family transcriptional regulator n=1 Tax=Streptomyces brasiliensis TaxID=1954 RepID=A0A917PC79_9ACTN|nr:helix-turn-helix domain-containing protein [Streptomyces brasiliensis]GGJ70252.1 HxlR family transcriptional regulator [Streptomyces brasiliensis]